MCQPAECKTYRFRVKTTSVFSSPHFAALGLRSEKSTKTRDPISRYVIAALILLFFTFRFHAQITDVTADQTPPIAGVEHNYIQLLNETVNPATGSVSVRIGVPVPPGRGVTVPFAFTYDSNSAHHLLFPAWGDTSPTWAGAAGHTCFLDLSTKLARIRPIDDEPP
jgi:hypothetical protein